MVIDNFLIVLRTMDQAVGTDFIDQSGSAGGVAEDFANRGVREYILDGPGMIKMPSDIITRLGSVIMVKAGIAMSPPSMNPRIVLMLYCVTEYFSVFTNQNDLQWGKYISHV